MIDDAKIAELKAKHGELFAIELDEDEIVVFRRPTRLEFRAYKSNSQDESKRAVADEILCKSVVVYPEGDACEALLDKLPAASLTLAKAIVEKSGGTQASAKKL